MFRTQIFFGTLTCTFFHGANKIGWLSFFLLVRLIQPISSPSEMGILGKSLRLRGTQKPLSMGQTSAWILQKEID